MNYKVILFDFDDTLVDFHDAEVQAYAHLMRHYEVPSRIHNYKRFKEINQNHWEAFQRGEITKAEVLSHRFIETFETYDMTVNRQEADIIFRDGLARAPIKWLTGVMPMLDTLSSQYTLAIVTNGVTDTQKRRIAQTNLHSMMNHIFISDQVGAQKPNVAFFEAVFEVFSQYDKKDFLIVGDSLTSDIQGGINAGIDTCWFNHRQLENQTTIQPTYTIEHIEALKEILM
ncbi:YjjG family noncanonical pyrimidine nucleotidase [Staphylococcus intermedius]|uniref:YjjG family noncanonical pyrimidine nucleotidase n=1 Tax=Staphylococcus intermedius TaxID=1285 RepID=UPI000BBC756D|nr:YjjG family noncanonical pyrimidine nucleotidase [Staphylococcus intermedius]PCF88648.1 noncanonical pyrimidine nucleotidase, YjjG family [Staphylococcus intermedius]